jgi:hypothetical protein
LNRRLKTGTGGDPALTYQSLARFLTGCVMSASSCTGQTVVLEHGGYQIRLSQTGVDWIAFVALPRQRPTLFMAPDREAVIALAHEWIDKELWSARSSA